MKSKTETLILTSFVLALMGTAPNLFVVAQAGYVPLSLLGKYILVPSVVMLPILIIIIRLRGHQKLARQILVGFIAGLLGTVGLEVVRHSGFLLGGMPGEMPKLLGVLLLNRFALGPNLLSNLAGWGYHFWNGAAFGIIYTLLLGRGTLFRGVGFAILIGVGFMAGPAATSLGVGRFGMDFGWGFPVTVTLAHIAFGVILGLFVFLKNGGSPTIIDRIKAITTAESRSKKGR